jgi:drug/metabolite transporter (DMT)-like permease
MPAASHKGGALRSGVGYLALFILLRGSDSTLLKLLQRAGEATHAAGGPEAISFCNVFFFSSVITGLALLLIDREGVQRQLPSLNPEDRWLLALQSFSGFFLGPMCFYLALDRLGVVEQTLLFSLTLPTTALLARTLIREALPRSFALSCAMVSWGCC